MVLMRARALSPSSPLMLPHTQLSLLASSFLLRRSPQARRESDSSYGLSPYTFDRLHALQASGKVTFIAERAESITPTEVKTKSHVIALTNAAIDATGFDITKSLVSF